MTYFVVAWVIAVAIPVTVILRVAHRLRATTATLTEQLEEAKGTVYFDGMAVPIKSVSLQNEAFYLEVVVEGPMDAREKADLHYSVHAPDGSLVYKATASDIGWPRLIPGDELWMPIRTTVVDRYADGRKPA